MKYTRYAVVDLETTGNQTDQDDIIQIGIVFVENKQIIDTYHSMIKTDQDIPAFIQALTSIENNMLQQAPYFHDIAHIIFQQLQGCVFVAHNAHFDLNFLTTAFEKCHIQYQPKSVIDTLELFKIAFPTEKSYQLSELSESLGISLEQAHRADEDAKTTARLMIKAFNKFELLPLDTKKQLYYLSKQLKFQLDNYFFELVRQHQPAHTLDGLSQYEQLYYKVLPDLEEKRIDFTDSLKAFYQYIITRTNYQYREDQLYLAEVIFNQLLHNDNALIEASTGSGKSLAYLIAALMYYIETGEHVIISTNTKLLQYQLLYHDIPRINQALNTQINAALIKSKRDYISLGLIQQILKDRVTNNYEVDLLKMQLLIWILETNTGDIQELNLRGGVKMYLDQKIETYIPMHKDIHYYQYIRNNAHHIQIGITNHAHLLHATHDHTIYQFFNHCIVDEAHRLPDYALDCVVHKISYSEIKYQLGLIGKTENEKLLYQLDQLEQRRTLEKLNIPHIDILTIKQDINVLHDMNEAMFDYLFDKIQTLHIYEDESSKLSYVFDLQSSELLSYLKRMIHHIHKTLEHFNNMKHKTVKTFRKQLLHIVSQFKTVEDGLKANQLFYISIKNIHQKSTIQLHIKSSSVKDVLTDKLLHAFQSLTFISGTLTFNQSFDTFKNWFHHESFHFNTYQLQPVHQQYRNGHIFIPKDIASFDYQNYDSYIETIVSYIARYVITVNGKCLVLFANYKMLYHVMEYLNELSTFEEYVILAQQQSQNYKIVQQFNHFDKAILLGTSSFFEGFDYQAHGIKCVMITKLPFMSQYSTQPLLLRDEFENVFKDYILPEAVTRFKQGLGRLLRNETDRGIVVSFDDRLINSHYRHFFQQTLEPYHQHQGDIEQFENLLTHLKKDTNTQNR
ncbi:helicase C-terminal domain-containing protein [Staphylococcus sp. 17KM0847]|uniref:helicase C-terminal domain-containing protein n=1 Tax=Staphylococcus sp. 17KM0847 TaxID=2583989 RepID=UPI0015DC966E|nr:helicase C-terminal domain-containing protein [Staphylococcus sp. 17KM0847]QLK86156.1 DEAD/DEAH box helicase [Staphylococcus sp. 17KM0847]